MLVSLKNITNEILVANLKSMKDKENATLAEIVHYLSELDCRQIYRDLGYSSLFSFCTEGLGYSESSASRRIQAARSLKANLRILCKAHNLLMAERYFGESKIRNY